MTEFEDQVPSRPQDAMAPGQPDVAPDDRDDEIARLEAEIARRNDPKAKRLAELRAQLAQLDAPADAVQAPAPAVMRADGLVGPEHTAWDDIPKATDIPISSIEDPAVRAILAELRRERAQRERLERLLATQGAPSNDAVPAADAVLHLSTGRTVKHATSIPTHHWDDEAGVLAKVVSGYYEHDADSPPSE